MHERNIIALSVVLGFSFVSTMVVIGRFLWLHKSAKGHADEHSEYSVHPNEPHVGLFSRDGTLMRIFNPKRHKGTWVPKLSGVIKAGDEGAFSSTLFHGLHGPRGELSLEMIYEAFANEIRNRPVNERSTYPPAISEFLAGTKRGVTRSQSVRVSRERRPTRLPRPPRTSIDLAEMGLGRSKSRRISPVLVSTFNALPAVEVERVDTVVRTSWTKDLQQAHYFEGNTGITVSPEELAALTVLLGSPLESTHAAETREKPASSHAISAIGAFGISINVAPIENEKYRITLKQHKRSISQLPAHGSGYSTLIAKHLASSSLPFSLNTKTVNSIVITTETFEAIQSGTCLRLQQSSTHTRASRFLSSLPSSRNLNLHTLTPSKASTSTSLFLHSVASLPFSGGLVPLAATPLVNSIQLIASGGLPPARLLQRLEALVDKVHRHSPGLQLFGPLYEEINAGLLYREHERLGRLATSASVQEMIADKAARMRRYITLLERLMCLVPDMKPHDVLVAVREATKKEIETSYEDAVATFKSGEQKQPEPGRVMHKRHSSSSARTRRSKRSSGASTFTMASAVPISPNTTSSPRHSSTCPDHNLGKRVEQILKSPLPFSIETIAFVVRMILVAWTLSVEKVAWEEGEDGVTLLDPSTLPDKMVMW